MLPLQRNVRLNPVAENNVQRKTRSPRGELASRAVETGRTHAYRCCWTQYVVRKESSTVLACISTFVLQCHVADKWKAIRRLQISVANAHPFLVVETAETESLVAQRMIEFHALKTMHGENSSVEEFGEVRTPICSCHSRRQRDRWRVCFLKNAQMIR